MSEHGASVDGLFYFILWLTGGVFVVTEVALFWFIWKYDANNKKSEVKYRHGSHVLEVVWTIVPAAVLLFLAIYQMNTWADIKMRRPNMAPTVEVIGRQFEWRLRYPGRDGVLGTPDDLHLVNDLHLPIDEDILIQLKNGEEIKHKDLLIKSTRCINSEFDDNPEITAYIQVKDLTNKNKDGVFVFNGWMFSSSPSIKPFDHPVYDIWLVNCY